MLKKTAIILLIGLVHFALSVAIVSLVMAVETAGEGELQTPSAMFRLLAGITKLLHFPIISLAWYSRHWFPGNWIYIPMGLNSILWGIGIYFCTLLSTKFIKRRIYK
jgi:hypothetical protein